MKNFKTLKESLLATAKSVTELTRDEQKMVNGGNYVTYEECLADCPGTLTGDYG